MMSECHENKKYLEIHKAGTRRYISRYRPVTFLATQRTASTIFERSPSFPYIVSSKAKRDSYKKRRPRVLGFSTVATLVIKFISLVGLIRQQRTETLWAIPSHSKVGQTFDTNTDPMTFGVDHRGQEFRNSKNTRVSTASLAVSCLL
jgi:hypothetical protein